MPAKTTITSTTQNFLDIFDITNDITIMNSGACSLILMVNAMNFGLLAEEEQDAIIYTYAALLNSLNYPIQIVIQSQTKDATAYLRKLEVQEQRATSHNKQTQINKYRQFVSQLIKERNVLDKKFYVVITATSLEMGLLGAQSVISGSNQIDLSKVEKSTIVEKATNILEPRRDHLVSQFGRLGLYARQLNTQEIIRVFYNSYNPESVEGQQITDSSNYTTPIVKASTTGGIMSDLVQPTSTQPQAAQQQIDPTTTQAPASQPQPEVAQDQSTPLVENQAPPTESAPTLEPTPVVPAMDSATPPMDPAPSPPPAETPSIETPVETIAPAPSQPEPSTNQPAAAEPVVEPAVESTPPEMPMVTPTTEPAPEPAVEPTATLVATPAPATTAEPVVQTLDNTGTAPPTQDSDPQHLIDSTLKDIPAGGIIDPATGMVSPTPQLATSESTPPAPPAPPTPQPPVEPVQNQIPQPNEVFGGDNSTTTQPVDQPAAKPEEKLQPIPEI